MKSVVLFCLVCVFIFTSDVLGQKRKDNKRARNNRNKNINFDKKKVAKENMGHNRSGQIGRQNPKNAPNFKRGQHGTTRYDRRSKVSTQPIVNHRPGISPRVDITEAVIVPAVCNECKRKDPTQQTCKAICPDLGISTGDGPGIGGVLPLGDQYCYFCENYRTNMTYYNLCRNRFCASG